MIVFCLVIRVGSKFFKILGVLVTNFRTSEDEIFPKLMLLSFQPNYMYQLPSFVDLKLKDTSSLDNDLLVASLFMISETTFGPLNKEPVMHHEL